MMNSAREIELIHLSDLHFGKEHRFDPPLAPDGKKVPRNGWPTLADSLVADFSNDELIHPVVELGKLKYEPRACPHVVCITGDLATVAAREEFDEATALIDRLKKCGKLNLEQGMDSIFVIPGNHDVAYKAASVSARWSTWNGVYNELHNTSNPASEPNGYVTLRWTPDKSVAVLSLNSETYVQDIDQERYRGVLDVAQLAKIKKLLQAANQTELKSAIKIALVHHHPILIPQLAESDRDYDAIVGAEQLWSILHQFKLHVLLHGHKHFPFTFVEDVRNGFESGQSNGNKDHALIIVAGGSVGSRELPNWPHSTNCYNRIRIKWDPAAEALRVKVITRGLVTHKDGYELLPPEWHWVTRSEDDRWFSAEHFVPRAHEQKWKLRAQEPNDKQAEQARICEYVRTRGHMAVADVRPSLTWQQRFEVKFWLVQHRSQTHPPRKEDEPIEVTWSAGEKFPVITIARNDDPFFCGMFEYWGPMLIQARMKFADGTEAFSYVYARMPGQ